MKREDEPANCKECAYFIEGDIQFLCNIDKDLFPMGGNITPCNEGVKKND